MVVIQVCSGKVAGDPSLDSIACSQAIFLIVADQTKTWTSQTSFLLSLGKASLSSGYDVSKKPETQICASKSPASAVKVSSDFAAGID